MMNNLMLTYYGFNTTPFSKDIPVKDVFAGASYTEALGMLSAAAGDEDVVLPNGEIGTGKSVVLRSFLHEL